MAAIVMRGPSLQLPWQSLEEDNRTYKRILKTLLITLFIVGLIIPFIPVPEPERKELEELPPQLAQVILEKKELPKPEPKPKPKPKPKPEKPKEKPKPKPEPKPEPKPKPKPEPKPVQLVEQAREKAATSGLMQFKDDLADMRDTLEMADVASANLSRGVAEARKVDRSVITSQARGTSGGISTAALSRDTGGVALSGRETTKVDTPVALKRSNANKASTGGGRDQSARSDEEIRKIMDRNKGAIFAIYNRALRKNPGLQGKVTVQIVIEPSGQVASAKIVSSDLNDDALEKKLLARIRLIAFSANNVLRTTLNYSFDFLPY